MPETLISFASGALPEPLSAIVACHLTMCRVCAHDVRRLEILGGVLLGRLDTAPVDKASIDRAQARGRDPSEGANGNASRDYLVLASFLKQNQPLGRTAFWKPVAPGVQQYRLPLPQTAEQLRLLRLSPGESVPRSSGESELALVLHGRFADAAGNDYLRGDVIEWEDGVGPPVTAIGVPECICLVSNKEAADSLTAPVRMTWDWARTRLPEVPRLAEDWQWSAVLAASLAMLAGIGIGGLIWGGPEKSAIAGLISYEGNRVIALDVLRDVLDTLPSGEERRESLDGQNTRFSIRMTFQEAGDYCRQYQISTALFERYAGIACRKGEDWEIRIQALVPPASSTGKTVPANDEANAAMDAVIGAWSSSDPIVGQDEAAIIGRGWRK